MARPSSQHPTELELEILKILWREGEATVKQVREALAASRDLAYTSVMTIMTIMVDKGYLKRSKQAGRFVYQAAISQQDTTTGILGNVVDRVFDGSAMAAVVHLLETRNVDEAELAELRKLIQRKRKEGQS